MTGFSFSILDPVKVGSHDRIYMRLVYAVYSFNRAYRITAPFAI